MMAAADLVVAGNAFLAEGAASCGAGARVAVIPTCVDPLLYSPANHRRRGPGIQMAWIGSSSTLQGLEQSRDLWEHLGQRIPGLILKLICDRPLAMQRLRVNFCPWSEAGEAAALADADIGISWLPADAWSRGKCGLKVLQYMAAGLPVVANPVGVQAEMVQHGSTGFLAETPEQWRAAVQSLASDPALRSRLGQAGRERLEREFSVAAGAAKWKDVLDRLGASARKAG
jgi:glycosyltransferase involved in cell wall biosynthesis